MGHSLLICSVKKDNNIWNLYDSQGEKLREPFSHTVFPSSMNRRYRAIRKKYICEDDTACVWYLLGKNKVTAKWLQVGRTKNLRNLLSNDVKEDIKEIFSGYGKYGQLKDIYSELLFYEIDVKAYIECDKEAKVILGSMPDDKNLRQAYLVNCAAYIEGKLAYKNEVELYHSSTLDGYYYDYFKDNRNLAGIYESN